jgi:hypothetical protein
VPCIRLTHMTDAQRRAYILADNRIALNSGWDDAMLALELQGLETDGLDLGLVGFDEAELQKLLQGMDLPAEQINEDEIPEVPVDPVTKPGDLWTLGKHRLLCGDSTKAANYGTGCKTLVFDPPWDAGIVMDARKNTLVFCDAQRAGDAFTAFGAPAWLFAWDCITSWYSPNRPLKRMKLCFWYGDLKSYKFDGAHYGEPSESKTVTNTRGSYEFVGDNRGKHLSDVFSAPITKLHAESEHSHSKPLDWVRMLLGNCTQGDIYDPFCGSGTTLIAAEQLGRKCYGMEISPQYCDVIVKRWETLTGSTATRESTP